MKVKCAVIVRAVVDSVTLLHRGERLAVGAENASSEALCTVSCSSSPMHQCAAVLAGHCSVSAPQAWTESCYLMGC